MTRFILYLELHYRLEKNLIMEICGSMQIPDLFFPPHSSTVPLLLLTHCSLQVIYIFAKLNLIQTEHTYNTVQQTVMPVMQRELNETE